MTFRPITGTYLDDFTVVCWIIIAVGTGVAIYHKTCTNAIECSALAILSVASVARAFGVWDRQVITADSALFSISAAIYVIVRYYQAWQKGKRK